MSNKLLTLCILMCASSWSLAQGQSRIQEQVVEVRILYQNLQYEQAIQQATQLLANPDGLTSGQLSNLHRYTAFSYFDLGQTDSARVHILSLLLLEPDFEPDPLRHSPKLIKFISDIRRQMERESDQPLPVAHTRYLFASDPRPAAALRSALVPGWGQFYKKENLRATVYFSGFVIGGAAWITTAIGAREARASYLDAGTPALAATRYETYNQWYRARQYAAYTVSAFWISGFIDALVRLPDELTFTPAKKGDGIGLSLSF